MNTPIRLVLSITLAGHVCLPLPAQPVADGASATLANVTNSITGDVIVGTNGSFTLLTLANNSLLTNSGNGSIGLNATAKSNEVRLISPSARWIMGNHLLVGSNGASSRLVVSNGARVENFDGILAQRIASSNNVALITGSGSRWTNRGDVTVGFSGRDNLMVVSNGGWVTDRFGYLGRQPGSSNNLAIVTGNGSVWSNLLDLQLGFNDRGNRLVIENGGLVTCAYGLVSGSSTSGNNEALVTASGSLWSNRFFLTIGDVAGRNRLVVSNGGAVVSANGILGNLSPAVSNQVIVTGSGSKWGNEESLALGGSSAGNRVDVSDGGRLECNEGYIGQDISAINNTVFLVGGGSRWNILANLFVGFNGSGNRLIASNGAAVVCLTNLVVGGMSSSTNNRLMVDNGSLFVTNAGRSALLDVRRGTNVFNSGLIEVDRLFLTNVQSRFEFNGGTLITRGAAISNEESLWMGASSTSPAIWRVLTGAGDHQVAVPLFIGASSPFNQLLITNGARMLSSRLAIIGLNSTAVSNSATISGPNSRWSLTDLYVGYSGDDCRLVIANGGFLSANYITVGGEGSTMNCEAVVTDPGTVLSNALTGGLQIGSTGSSNRVRIENGGTLFGSVQVGRTLASVGNLLSVTGSGSSIQVLTNFIPISVGYDGPASRMEVSGGGAVLGYDGEIGRNMSSSNNWVLVTGIGSMWSNINDFYLGVSGAGNRLHLTNGGQLYNYNGFLGGNTYSSNNQAWVIGPGSTWTNYRELSVGLNGTGNQLVITNGGTVSTFANKYVGYNDGGLSNTVIVTDAGSAWLGDDSLYVGSDGSFNRLLVRNGGRVVNGLGSLGGLFGANGNQVLVTDGGSVWTNQQELTVGDNGSANTLIVSNGATVFSASDGFIGRNSGGRSNTVILTDPGTRWLISSNLYAGSNGAFSRLVVSNGARLHDRFAVIGGGPSSSNNAVMISGVGSVWSNTLDLTIGDVGTANQMVISSGAFVTCSNGTLGGKIASSNNAILVTGAGSVWSNRGGLFVSQAGNGNRLIISDGGLVHTMGGGFLGGSFATGTNNEVVVTGPGSFWRLPSTLFVGYVAGGNRLVITNGGWVYNSTANVGLIGNSNEVLVTGAGSSWTNSGTMVMGVSGSQNRLIVSNGGVVHEPFDLRVGENASSTNNRIVVDGGILVMESPTFGIFDIKRGTNVLNAGRIFIGRELLVTNILGIFEFNGGTLQASGTSYTNGRVFTVGNGTSPAIFELAGGEHAFANGLTIANQGILTGQGLVRGSLTAQVGSVIAPGVSIGTLALNSAPMLQGKVVLEVRGGAVALENDQIQVAGNLNYGGSLVVSNSGGSALLPGDRFQLFGATGFSGAFTNILLPPLTVGLQWTNQLNVDGSIEVIPYQPPPVTLNLQRSNGVLLVSWPTNGADYCLETTFDLSPPVTWQTVSSGIATNGGSFVLTLAGHGQSLKQFFRLAFPCAPSSVMLALQINNNLVTVSWPSNAFRLETTFSLSTPITWQLIDTGITDTNGLRTFSLTNNLTVTNQFFRLASP